MRIFIKNGTIVTAAKTFTSDIFLSEGKIVEIGEDLEVKSELDTLINAEGKYIFPGGIDPHVHMHLPTPAGYSSDDFVTGSKAALFGGTTLLIDFVTPRKGQSLAEALANRKIEAKGALCDYSFHVSPIEWTSKTEMEIKEIIHSGITSFKVYMAYKDSIGLNNDDILKVMQVVGRYGGIVTLHCELGDEIDKLRQKFAANGNAGQEFHPLSRPAYTEAEAVKEAINLADNASCPIYIVHTSAGASTQYIKEAQLAGQKVYAETCPQYLLLDDSQYLGSFKHASKYVMSPPLRKKEDQDILWASISKGTVKTIGTDHCPFTFEQKMQGINDFRKIPNGAGGVEHRMKLLFTYGVLENQISLNQFVELTSTNAATIFGLYPRKGEIAVGADADLLVWNPKTENTISVESHNNNCNLEPYAGFKTIGEPEIVIRNGEIVVENAKLISEITGQFLKRTVD